jgi:DNA-binding MarR family transcriptional regulator
VSDVESTHTTPNPEGGRSYADRWRYPELLAPGYLVVPSVFLQHYSQLKPHSLTNGEVLLVLHLMDHKWDAAAPFPSYGTLARRMGVSQKMVRRYAQTLEQKGCLQRVSRAGNTNLFDLEPLFKKLLDAMPPRPWRAD